VAGIIQRNNFESRKARRINTGFSTVPSGRIMFWDANPARCAGLISSCPFGTKQSHCAGCDQGVPEFQQHLGN
jgi:hypothetical protein